MSEVDNGLEKKHQILIQKYKTLRRNHRKLAGIALRLVEALEAFLKGDGKPDIRNVIIACLEMYPGLVADSTAEEPSIEASEAPVESALVVTESLDLATEDAEGEVEESETPEKEYFKGFWSKPKIPRTPLV